MARVPKLRSGCDIRSLPLTPADGFLLSRVDASADEQELAMTTGFAIEQVARMLDRLVALGAVEYESRVTSRTRPHAPDDALPPPPPREDDVEIDLARRRRIDDLYARLDQLTHYALLGVEETAGTKQVKAAFHALAAELHPDRFFRKRLGPYQQKIEAIFSRLTLAHDVLVSVRRAAYDEELARRSAGRTPVEPGPTQQAATQHAPAPSSRVGPDEQRRLRREALARRLSGTYAKVTPVVRVELPAEEPDPEMAQCAAEIVRRHQERAVAEARAVETARGLEQARRALDRGDHEGAILAFRAAATLVPDDGEVQKTCDEGIRRAQRALADVHWAQAQEEEREARWEEAACCYTVVCTGRPGDARAHERAANAWLRVGDLRRAVEMARKAIELDPCSAMFRITLARAYGAAHLDTSFHGELERALELAPGDAKVEGIVARLRSQAQQIGSKAS
jgi:curved DNA-binding protein CbpA